MQAQWTYRDPAALAMYGTCNKNKTAAAAVPTEWKGVKESRGALFGTFGSGRMAFRWSDRRKVMSAEAVQWSGGKERPTVLLYSPFHKLQHTYARERTNERERRKNLWRKTFRELQIQTQHAFKR